MTIIKSIITTLDNLPILREQINILKDDSLISEIIVVNNGSIDGTREWLDSQTGLTVINHKENRGASVGRNSGIDKAGKCDYFLFLDGGIRPLIGGTEKLLEYLENTPDADVIGVEIPDFETDYNKAWRRWPSKIENTYRNTRLSHTAYCLTRYRAFDGIRFNETGPFGEAGWACEDDELAYQWNDKDIVIHVVTNVHPYRKASGSFQRLYEETGIWANQFGSVYEKRLVWLQQNYPQYEPGIQWGKPWLTIVIEASDIDLASQMIIVAHKEMRKRTFSEPWQDYPNPYSIVLFSNNADVLRWSRDRKLRQFYGDVIIDNGEIVRHKPGEEAKDFRVCTSELDTVIYHHYYTKVDNMFDLKKAIEKYNEVFPCQSAKNPPTVKGQLL